MRNKLTDFFNKIFAPKYKPGQFIITKSFVRKGQPKGNLVLRIEHIINNNLLCSKGRFEIYLNPKRREWVFDEQKLIQISTNNIEKTLTENQAVNELQLRIK